MAHPLAMSHSGPSSTKMPHHNNEKGVVKSQQENRLNYKIVFSIRGLDLQPFQLFFCLHSGRKLLPAIMGYNTGVKWSEPRREKHD